MQNAPMEATNCRKCGHTINSNYCSNCGEKTTVSVITLHSITHEIFHYFTHLDKGFGYTLKKLLATPGTMQRRYIDGERSGHQKPFSMFFLCGTISGLGYYFIKLAAGKIYGSHDLTSQDFFRHYFVLLQAFLLPAYTLITWLFFKNERYNYAETLIMMLYNLSLVFLVLIPINALNLVFPDFETKIIELIFLVWYNFRTNLNFYSGKKVGLIVRSVFVILGCFIVSQLFSSFVVALLD